MPRWFTALSQMLARRRAPEFAVSIRRVFVMPTRHGLMAALAIFGIFAISVRIQNNMLLLMAVALFVIFALSLLWAGQNLKGLRLQVRHDGRIVAGETARLSVVLAADRPVYDIRIDAGEGARPALRAAIGQGSGVNRRAGRETFGRETPGGENSRGESYGQDGHALNFSPERRGRQALPLVRLETAFPFGLARAWAWISPAEVLVAPVPDYAAALAHLTGDVRQGAAAGREDGGADSLEDWVPGIPETRISWKRYAATDRLLAKTGDASGGSVLTITYDAVAHLGHERALSAMSAAVLRAARAGRPFHFRLHQIDLRHVTPQSAGKALDALALA